MNLETLTYVDSDGDEQSVREYIERDTGDAPGSRYGTRADQWAPVALAAVAVFQHETGEADTTDSIDGIVSLVVNDSDDIATLLRDYGHDIGIDWRDYIDPPTCPTHGEEYDRDCFGEDRCVECDGPCPGCYAG